MIQHPSLLADLAQIKHQERLKEAEQERLYRQIGVNHPNLLQQAVALVKRIGQQRRSPRRTRLTTDTIPVFNK